MEVGLTLLDQVPFPFPATVPPLLLSVSVQLPVAVTVPEMLVLVPVQMLSSMLVMEAFGPCVTVTSTEAQEEGEQGEVSYRA